MEAYKAKQLHGHPRIFIHLHNRTNSYTDISRLCSRDCLPVITYPVGASIMRSFATRALCLTLLHTTDARVPHSFRRLVQRDAQPDPQPQEGVFEWFRRLLKRDIRPRQDATCYEDDYYVFVGSPSLGEPFCQDYMDYPNRTVPVEATATRYEPLSQHRYCSHLITTVHSRPHTPPLSKPSQNTLSKHLPLPSRRLSLPAVPKSSVITTQRLLPVLRSTATKFSSYTEDR